MTNHNGKEYEKEYICVCKYVCVTELLCCTEVINSIVNQLYLNTIEVCKINRFGASAKTRSKGQNMEEKQVPVDEKVLCF